MDGDRSKVKERKRGRKDGGLYEREGKLVCASERRERERKKHRMTG